MSIIRNRQQDTLTFFSFSFIFLFLFFSLPIMAQPSCTWAKNIGSTNNDEGKDITTDASGNIYITGTYSGTADFDPSSGTSNLISQGSTDIFIAKYDANGTLIWAKSIGGTNADVSTAIAVDGSKNIYISGHFTGTADFDPEVATTANLTSLGMNDIFFAKYDSDGNYTWAKSIGGTQRDQANDITADNLGNVYITGEFNTTVDFDPGIGNASYTAGSAGSFYYEDPFFAKYDSNGNYIWAKQIGNPNSVDRAKAIAVNEFYEVYVTGEFFGVTDFNPGAGTNTLTSTGGFDVFFCQYNSDGSYNWARNIGGAGTLFVNDIKLDGALNVFLTGSFSGTADFKPGSGAANLISVGGNDAFLGKYNNTGSYLWAKQIGSINDDVGNGISIDASNNIYVTGSFSGTADFDPDAGTINLTPTSTQDLFLAKYSTTGAFVSSGTYIWAANVGSTNSNTGNKVVAYDNCSVYLTGAFYGTTNFNPTGDANNLTSSGNKDAFFAKYGTVGMSIATTYANCSGNSNDGSASITAAGGTIPYTYSWNNSQTNSSATGLSIGTYTITVNDINGCYNTRTLSISCTPTSTVYITNSSNVTCNGKTDGAATASMLGGTAPYNYSWSNGQTTATATGLSAGTYIVKITDITLNNGTVSIIITQPNSLNISNTLTNISCGVNNGSASATISGGTTPYTYNWSNNKTTANATGLSAGTYTLTVIDNKGCSTSNTLIITEAPAVTSAIVSTTTLICNGDQNGSITASAANGTLPYKYSWSPSGQTSTTATGLSGRTYTLIITDGNGCTSKQTTTISQPAKILVSILGSPQYLICGTDGYLSVTSTGGTPPYTYQWNVYNGSSWILQGGPTTSNTGTITAAEAVAGNGNYGPLTITDAQGCTSLGFNTTMFYSPPLNITTVSISAASCGSNNGSASISASGAYGYNNGTGNTYGFFGNKYTYSWNPSGQTNASATGLSAGTYTVTVISTNTTTPNNPPPCSTFITVIIPQNASLNVITSKTDPTDCNSLNGLATATASGGTAPITYAWNNGQTTSTITGLSIGTYTISVSDAGGCSAINSITLTCTSNNSVIVSIVNSTNIKCFGDNNGTATATMSGGTAPINYLWSNGKTINPLTGLAAGTYTVTVTDANNKTASATVLITEPDILNSSNIATNTSCNQNNGTIASSVSGGTIPYTYLWSNGSTNNNIVNLSADNYTLLVTDNNGCSTTTTASISSSETGTVSITINSTIKCYGDNNGIITGNMIGGTPNYKYTWSNNTTEQTVSSLIAGNYTLTVTDNNGCSESATVILTQPLALTITSEVKSDTCTKYKGTISVTAFGGTGNYSYAWNNNSSNQQIDQLSAGNYYLIVSDSNGCTKTMSTTVNDINTTSADAGADITINQGDSTQLNGTGSPVKASFNWKPSYSLNNPNITNPIATPKVTTTYTLTVNDVNGCTTVDVVTITVETDCSKNDIFIPNSFSPNEDGNNDFVYVRSNCIKTMNLSIYNRWGEKVFESNNQKEGWDGRFNGNLLSNQVLAYYLNATMMNGEIYSTSGNINLIK